MAERSAAPDPAVLPARVTTPLLTLLTQQSLDEDYLHVAERRAAAAAAGEAPREAVAGGGRHLRAGIVLALFGLIVMTAVIQTSRTASTDQADRATLIDRITSERGQVRSLQSRVARLTDADAAAERSLTALTTTAASARTRERRLQVRTGYLAVRGPGVRITVTNPEGGDPLNAVRDTDLRRLVNGLWQAGAEAIAINGQRISVLSAIRNSGVVVNLNYQPLRPPYVVSAVGDPRTLQADLLDTASGAEFVGLVRQYGFGFTMQNVGDDPGLSLPAAPRRQLRSARPSGSPARTDLQELTP